jgi:cyclophilin family peptidyl-prolyl cis-trans isomerase/HEAT repeat protein
MRYRPDRLFIVLLVLAAACGPAPALVAPGPLEQPQPLSEEAIVALSAIMRLEDRREFVDEAFRGWLAHPDPVVRSRAALGLGRIGAPGAVPLLSHALHDPVAGVRADAAFALGQLADTSAATVDALRRLLRASIDDGSVAVAVEAAGALGKTRVPAARAALEAEVLACQPATPDACAPAPEPVVVEALLAVWRLPDGVAALAHVWRHASVPAAEVRWAAVNALFRFAAPHAVPALLSAAADPDALVRATALRGLRATLADSANARPQAAAAVLAALSDAHPHVRINAVRVAPGYAADIAAGHVVALLGDRDDNVALAAAEALGELANLTTAPQLAALAADPTARIALRAAAIAALLRADPSTGATAVRDLARSESWLHRVYAARLLARLPAEAAANLAAALARDDDPRVVATALGSLAATRPDTIPTAYAFFLEGLAHPDPEVRAAALRALEARADPADLLHLLEAYARAVADPVPLAALAAVDALAALARRGVPVERSFFVRFQRHPNALVRARVAAAIGAEWGAVWPTETRIDHEALVRHLVAPVFAGSPLPRVRIRTGGGDIVLELAAADAPRTVANFLWLAEEGYFDGGRWHRVVPNFVLQDGDPRGAGSGGPGWSIRDEMNRLRYRRGILGMALAGPDTGGSQFFITHAPQPHLDGGYTVFGRVIQGMDVADRIVQDDPIHSIERLP